MPQGRGGEGEKRGGGGRGEDSHRKTQDWKAAANASRGNKGRRGSPAAETRLAGQVDDGRSARTSSPLSLVIVGGCALNTMACHAPPRSSPPPTTPTDTVGPTLTQSVGGGGGARVIQITYLRNNAFPAKTVSPFTQPRPKSMWGSVIALIMDC